MFRTAAVRAPVAPSYFYDALRKRGTTSFFGVPDSLLKSFCAYVTDHSAPGMHVITANEGNAMAMAAGHYLATGCVACVYLQNSGIGNIANPALSLMHREVYRLPCLLVIGWRGQPGKRDEPQHVAQGRLSPACLDSMEIPHATLAGDGKGDAELDAILNDAYRHFGAAGTPYAVLVEKGAVGPYTMRTPEDAIELFLSREEALEQVVRQLDDRDVVVSTTGMPSREVFEIRERTGLGHQRDFLTVGSMGHCSSIAAGVALARRDRGVYCIDGDGAVILHMGALAVNGATGANKSLRDGGNPLRNFKHIVINNGAHDSVGGQPTAAMDASLSGVARACGYNMVREEPVLEIGELVRALGELRACEGPAFLEVLVRKGNRADLGRPTPTPTQNKAAFMGHLQGDVPPSPNL